MDARLLEVAIGLVLIFALSSLMATAMMEAWSSWRGLRGRNLITALVSFVGDDKSFADALMKHPLLVSLAPQDAHADRRPSYISADVVVSSLVGLLTEAANGGKRPASPAELLALLDKAKINISTMALPNTELTRALATLVQGVEDDWIAFEQRLCAWYDAVGERSIGWFKRQVQLGLFICGFLIAAVGNINPFELTPRLWNDPALRQAMMSAAENATKSYAAGESGPPVTGDCERQTDPALRQLCMRIKEMAEIKSAGLPMGWTVPFPPPYLDKACVWGGQDVKADGACSRGKAWFNLLFVLAGWCITAFACMLGAPFWFDMLSKLVKLRGTGARSSSDEGATPPAAARSGVMTLAKDKK